MADFLSLLVKNEHERKKQSKSNRIKSDPRRNQPQEKKVAFQKELVKKKHLAFCTPLEKKKLTLKTWSFAPFREIRMWM